MCSVFFYLQLYFQLPYCMVVISIVTTKVASTSLHVKTLVISDIIKVVRNYIANRNHNNYVNNNGSFSKCSK